MDAKAAAGAQRDEQGEATVETAIRTQVEAMLKNTNTCLPGIVKSFNKETQTAEVQPAIKRLFVEVGWVDLPLCVDVPVQFPSGGDFVMTFPVTDGDECLLVFSQRAIDFWWDRGGVQLPAEYRLHDLSDAFAVMGVSSKPRALTAFNTNGVELRTRAGEVLFRVEPDGVWVGGVPGAQPAVLGTALAAILVLLKAHTHPVSGAVAGPSPQLATMSTSPLAAKVKVL